MIFYLLIEPGLFLTTKGAKYESDDNDMGVDIIVKTNLYYLDIPLTIRDSHDLGDGLKIFGSVGPYAGLGLRRKAKTTAVKQGEEKTAEEDVAWGNDKNNKDDFKRLDMGLTFDAEVEINSISDSISFSRIALLKTAFNDLK